MWRVRGNGHIGPHRALTGRETGKTPMGGPPKSAPCEVFDMEYLHSVPNLQDPPFLLRRCSRFYSAPCTAASSSNTSISVRPFLLSNQLLYIDSNRSPNAFKFSMFCLSANSGAMCLPSRLVGQANVNSTLASSSLFTVKTGNLPGGRVPLGPCPTTTAHHIS